MILHPKTTAFLKPSSSGQPKCCSLAHVAQRQVKHCCWVGAVAQEQERCQVIGILEARSERWELMGTAKHMDPQPR